MGTGGHAEAAQIFERLAYGARDIGMELRAPNLFLQGALAYYLAANPETGQKLLIEGLEMLVQDGQWRRFSRLGERAVQALQNAGFTEAAQQTQIWLDQKLQGQAPESDEAPDAPGADQSRYLPVTCSRCGAVVRPDEVEWVNQQAAECAYCGSLLVDR
jgi:DNA-directed RNA polymerase subunit RPC12/RpoP